MSSIAFIGGGNMASCIIGGMVANGFDPQKILVGTPSDNTSAVGIVLWGQDLC